MMKSKGRIDKDNPRKEGAREICGVVIYLDEENTKRMIEVESHSWLVISETWVLVEDGHTNYRFMIPRERVLMVEGEEVICFPFNKIYTQRKVKTK